MRTLFNVDEDYYQELIRELAVGEVLLQFLGEQYNEYQLHSAMSEKYQDPTC